MNRFLVYFPGIVWSSIFGLSFLVTKNGLSSFSPFELLFLRFLVATFLMSVLARLRFVRLTFRGKPLGTLALLCLFQPLLYFACETLGLRETASSTGGLILGAMPALVALLGALMLKEGLVPRQVAGLVLSLAGVALIVVLGSRSSGPGQADSLRGILFLVGALLSAGFYNVYSRRASAWFSPAETTFAMMATGAIVFGLVALGERLVGGGPGILSRATPSALFSVAYLGILSSVLAFFLVNLTLSRLKASQSAVFGTLTTLVSLAAGALLKGESLGPLRLVGSAMIVVGVWATNSGSRGRVASIGDGDGRPDGDRAGPGEGRDR